MLAEDYLLPCMGALGNITEVKLSKGGSSFDVISWADDRAVVAAVVAACPNVVKFDLVGGAGKNQAVLEAEMPAGASLTFSTANTTFDFGMPI